MPQHLSPHGSPPFSSHVGSPLELLVLDDILELLDDELILELVVLDEVVLLELELELLEEHSSS